VVGHHSFSALRLYQLLHANGCDEDSSVSTSYAVFSAIGAVETAVVGILFFGEPATVARLTFLGLIVAVVVGLKFAAASDALGDFRLVEGNRRCQCNLVKSRDKRRPLADAVSYYLSGSILALALVIASEESGASPGKPCSSWRSAAAPFG
jgi:hypothetical protein